MAKTVFALLALVAVSFRYQGVFFARGFTLESGGYKAGISIPVTKYKREALDTCNPGVESVEEALQRCFTDRNINITKILDNPMLFVEIILGQMDVTCSRFDDYRHALECFHNFSSSCISEDLRDYIFPKFTYISSMMHRLCDNRDYINGKCAVSVYPDLFECLDVKIHNDSQFSDLGDTICFYQELATACVAEEMWRCGCNTTRVLVEIYKEDTRPLLCPPITSVAVPDCSNSTCTTEAEKNIHKCITDQDITFSEFDNDINGVIRMLTSHLEMSCSRFDDYKRALECVHNFTWSCLDEDIRDYVLPKFTYVSSVMHRLCNNREHLNDNCALSVYHNLHTCLKVGDDHSSFSNGNASCSVHERATQCIADKMRICGCMTTRVFIEIYKEDARSPLCPPITSVDVPDCSNSTCTNEAEKNIQKCITDQNITFSEFDDDINGVIRMLTSHLEMSCSRFDDYKRALECVHNFTWSCLDEDIRDYVLPKFTYVSSVMHRLCNNREHLDGNCALSVYNNLHTCLNLDDDDDDDSSFSDGNVFCWLRELATQCIADKMRICGCMTTRVFIEIYKEDARPPLCPPITSVAIPTCTGTRLTGDHPLGVVLVAAAIVLSLLSAPSSF